MKKYLIEWRQLREGFEHRFEDTFTALTLPLAVGQWQAKCYTNAEIVAVQLVEPAQCRKGVAA